MVLVGHKYGGHVGTATVVLGTGGVCGRLAHVEPGKWDKVDCHVCLLVEMGVGMVLALMIPPLEVSLMAGGDGNMGQRGGAMVTQTSEVTEGHNGGQWQRRVAMKPGNVWSQWRLDMEPGDGGSKWMSGNKGCMGGW